VLRGRREGVGGNLFLLAEKNPREKPFYEKANVIWD